MYFIKTDRNVKIRVQDLNPKCKKTICFIHGWPYSRKIFEYQTNIFPGQGYRCISIDLRGFGDSDCPWNGYTYNQMADDLYYVLKSIDCDDVILCGFSMGGAIGIRYMNRCKGYKVRKLALIAAAAPCFTRRPGFPYGMTIENINNIINQCYRDRPKTVADFGKNCFASHISSNIQDWFTDIAYDASGHGTIKCAEALRDEDLRGDLPCIKVPCGIFHGKLDKICPFPFALEMNKGIKCSTLYPFENSGHFVFYDELELFNSSFLNFCNS